MGSLEDDGGGVMGVDESAAWNELEAEAGVGKGDGVEVGVGIEELPLADGSAGKFQAAVRLEFGGGVFIVVNRHGRIGSDDELRGVEGRIELDGAGCGDGVIAAGTNESAVGGEHGEDQPGGDFEVTDQGGGVGLLERRDGSGLDPGVLIVGELDGQGGALGVAEETHGVVGDHDGHGAGAAGKREVIVANKVVDGAGVWAGLKGPGAADVERLGVGGSEGQD